MNAKCTLSDSGTISEESAILGFPAISLRQSMERPEAQDAGTIILTGFDPGIVLSSVQTVIEEYKGQIQTVKSTEEKISDHLQDLRSLKKGPRSVPAEYSISDTSWRVLKLVLGNARLSNRWWGVEK